MQEDKTPKLLNLLLDTRGVVADPQNIRINDLYSDWETHAELMEEIDRHILSLYENVNIDWQGIYFLYAPTVGLGEVFFSDNSYLYLELAERYDKIVSA